MRVQTEISTYRESTADFHRKAVERVIAAMPERMSEPLTLQDMADIAIMSPFHFNRVFRQTTGIPPGLFLSAVRLAEAKRLLFTTQLSVIDVSFEVGYNSLGTFTRRFTQNVGISPCLLRRLAQSFDPYEMRLLLTRLEALPKQLPSGSGITGNINVPDGFSGPVFVGLFRSPIPCARPVSCALVAAPGPYRLDPVPNGSYYIFAAALGQPRDRLDYLLSETGLRGVASQSPVVVRNNQARGNVQLTLASVQMSDPPILISLPLLLAQGQAVESNGIG